MASSTYHLFSTLPGEPNLGIWWLTAKQDQPTGQPVRLNADLVEWVASPSIVGGGPTRLSVGPYQYTYEYEEEAFATNDSNASQDWFLIPANVENTWLIAADLGGKRVWTAEGQGEPIKIKSFTGESNQLFRFVKKH